jgi:hypothetical protein
MPIVTVPISMNTPSLPGRVPSSGFAVGKGGAPGRAVTDLAWVPPRSLPEQVRGVGLRGVGLRGVGLRGSRDCVSLPLAAWQTTPGVIV